MRIKVNASNYVIERVLSIEYAKDKNKKGRWT